MPPNNNEIDWGKCRDADQDGFLNLHSAFQQYIKGLPPQPFPEVASAYLTEVDRLHGVSSPEVASVILLEAFRRGQEGEQ